VQEREGRRWCQSKVTDSESAREAAKEIQGVLRERGSKYLCVSVSVRGRDEATREHCSRRKRKAHYLARITTITGRSTEIRLQFIFPSERAMLAGVCRRLSGTSRHHDDLTPFSMSYSNLLTVRGAPVRLLHPYPS